MRHHIRAVLLDLDGVVVFTDRYHYSAWKRLADEQGWEFDEEVNHGCRGVPRMASLQVILDHNAVELPDEEKQRLAERKNDYYKESLGGITREDLYPGVLSFLERLRMEGVRLALCSSSKNARLVLDKLEIAGLFESIITGNEISRAKPDPEIFLLAAGELRVPPFHCLVFEDAESGIQAAHRAGMKSIGVGAGLHLPSAPETIETYDAIDVDALLDSGRPQRFPEEEWAITESPRQKTRGAYWATVFALSNGLIGLRGAPEERGAGRGRYAYPATFLNGIYGYQPYEHIWSFPGFATHLHAMLNLCDWTITGFHVDEEEFSYRCGVASDFRRSLNMKKGSVEKFFDWTSPAGKRVAVSSRRLVSMTRRHAAALCYTVTAKDPCRLRLRFTTRFEVPSKAIPGEQTRLLECECSRSGDFALIETTTGPFRVAAGFGFRVSGDLEGRAAHTCERNGSSTTHLFELQLNEGESITVEKHACFFTSVETSIQDLLPRAIASTEELRQTGMQALEEEQAEFWTDFWEENDVRIEGNPRDQQAMRFSLFHLRQSHPEDEWRSIGANCLTGDQYRGHVFWDTEMYMIPFFLYSHPELVRPLLMYRYNILEKARERARQMDGKGAMYSWNSISGEECAVVFEASVAEYHLQSAVAYAIWKYVEATDDMEFLHRYGAEILFETARFLEDRGAYIPHKGGRFCINAVCGPDEYGCGVNNNCYTNVMAKWHLSYAAEVFDKMKSQDPDGWEDLTSRIHLRDEEPKAWRRAAEAMYIPFNQDLGIHEQDDSFLSLDPVEMDLVPRNTDIRSTTHPLNLWRMQVCKQADVVLLMFVQGHQYPAEVKAANYAFYEPKTTHGSSLSACIHSIIASEIGRPEDAYFYFRQSVLMDLNDFKNNTGGGVHAACLGGTWMAAVNGFAGMRDYPGRLEFHPRLPKEWTSLRFPVTYRGRRLRVTLLTDVSEFELIDGRPLTFHVDGREVCLDESNRVVHVRA